MSYQPRQQQQQQPLPYSRDSSYSLNSQFGRPISSFYGGAPGGDSPQRPGHQPTGSYGFGGAGNRDSYLGTASNRGSVMMLDQQAQGYHSHPQAGMNNGMMAPGPGGGGRYSQLDNDDDDSRPLSTYIDPYAQQQQQGRVDLYADFMGVGERVAPRMSSADAYSPTAESAARGSLLEKDDASKRGSMAAGEFMTAPVLGKEWDDHEESRTTRVKVEESAWTKRGTMFATLGKRARGMFAWKRFIFIFAGLLAVLAIVLYFVIPRAPSFELSADTPLTADNDIKANFTRTPAQMQWQAQLNVAIDTKANWIPIHISDFELNVYDLDSYKRVGTGEIHGGRTSFPGRSLTPTLLNLNFDYRAKNDSDPTFINYYQACAHKYDTIKRPGLSIIVELKMGVRGKIGKTQAATTVSGLECPIELPANNS